MTEGCRYVEQFSEASLRHFADAEHLAADARWCGAGHLIGFAAECAIKHRISTLRPGADVPHGHFPEIVETAKRHLHQRRDLPILSILRIRNLFEHWRVELRYANDASVTEDMYVLWRDHTRRLMAAASLRGGG